MGVLCGILDSQLGLGRSRVVFRWLNSEDFGKGPLNVAMGQAEQMRITRIAGLTGEQPGLGASYLSCRRLEEGPERPAGTGKRHCLPGASW